MSVDLFGEALPPVRAVGAHESAVGGTDEWLTPPDLLTALGRFDLDPCAPIERPWPTAERHYTIENDGLRQKWHGRVWCNPPYAHVWKWLARLADHGTGTALIFARTETAGFHSQVWQKATALLFLKGRLHFYHRDGCRAKGNAGAPSVLVAYGAEDARVLANTTIAGHYVHLRDTA